MKCIGWPLRKPEIQSRLRYYFQQVWSITYVYHMNQPPSEWITWQLTTTTSFSSKVVELRVLRHFFLRLRHEVSSNVARKKDYESCSRELSAIASFFFQQLRHDCCSQLRLFIGTLYLWSVQRKSNTLTSSMEQIFARFLLNHYFFVSN